MSIIADEDIKMISTEEIAMADNGNSSDDQDTSSTTSESTTCRYSSKPCTNQRALKKTGDMHSFCEFHRSMANRNQRRCEHKRRTKRQIEKAIQKRIIQPQPIHLLMGMNVFQHPFEETTTKRRRSISSASNVTMADAPVIMDLPSISIHGPQLDFKTEPSMADAPQLPPLEPFAHPVPLHVEDLEYLMMTVVDSSSYSCVV